MSHVGNWKKAWLVAALCLQPSIFNLPSSICSAQSNDFGMWYELGVEEKLSPKWSLGGEAELRTRNNTRTLDRWSAGVSAEYKIVKGLKLSMGYTLLFDNNTDELDFKKDGFTPNKWKASHWGTRQRLNLSLTGSKTWGRLSASLRERWQFTYRHAAEGQKYDFDEEAWTDIKSKVKNVLRSRLQLEYNIPHWKLDPIVGIEMFNDKSGIQKMRYQVGTEYKLQKQHVFSLTYRFQSVNEDDDDGDMNSHLIGIGYKYKF